MHGAERRKDSLGGRRDVVLDRDIAGDCDRALSVLCSLGGGRDRGVAIKIDARDGRACIGECERDGAPNTGPRASDDGILALQRIEIIHVASPGAPPPRYASRTRESLVRSAHEPRTKMLPVCRT